MKASNDSQLHQQKQHLITRYIDIQPQPQVTIRDDNDNFDRTSSVFTLDLGGYVAEIDALLSNDDDTGVSGQSGHHATGHSD